MKTLSTSMIVAVLAASALIAIPSFARASSTGSSAARSTSTRITQIHARVPAGPAGSAFVWIDHNPGVDAHVEVFLSHDGRTKDVLLGGITIPRDVSGLGWGPTSLPRRPGMYLCTESDLPVTCGLFVQ